MNLGIRTGCFYPFAEPAKQFLAVNAFAPFKPVNALQQLGFHSWANGKIQLDRVQGSF